MGAEPGHDDDEEDENNEGTIIVGVMLRRCGRLWFGHEILSKWVRKGSTAVGEWEWRHARRAYAHPVIPRTLLHFIPYAHMRSSFARLCTRARLFNAGLHRLMLTRPARAAWSTCSGGPASAGPLPIILGRADSASSVYANEHRAAQEN
eukprot:366571-Chlamydomonas_euryale.AAC.5